MSTQCTISTRSSLRVPTRESVRSRRTGLSWRTEKPSGPHPIPPPSQFRRTQQPRPKTDLRCERVKCGRTPSLGFRTAHCAPTLSLRWSKPAVDILHGLTSILRMTCSTAPQGKGVDDLYTPEITNVNGFDATVSHLNEHDICTSRYGNTAADTGRSSGEILWIN